MGLDFLLMVQCFRCQSRDRHQGLMALVGAVGFVGDEVAGEGRKGMTTQMRDRSQDEVDQVVELEELG